MRRFLWLALFVALVSPSGARAPGQPLALSFVTSGNSLAFTVLANGAVSSTVAGSGTYTGTAPSSFTSATWGGGCSGSSTPSSVTFGSGAWSATFTTPSSAGVGCTLAVVTDLTTSATSPGVAITSGSYTGPLDIVATADFCGALRACASATRGTKAANVCNVADVVCIDLLTNPTTGDLTITTIGGSSCAVVICTVKILYDQSGNGNDRTQPTIGNRPQLLTAGCSKVGVPCMLFVRANSQYLDGSFPVRAQPHTYSMVGARTGSFTTVADVASTFVSSGTLVQFTATTNTMAIYGGTTTCFFTVSDGVWHSLQMVLNGVTSAVNVDGSEPLLGCNPGTSSTGNAFSIGSDPGNAFGQAADAVIAEMIFFPSGLSLGNRGSEQANQKAYWGTP